MSAAPRRGGDRRSVLAALEALDRATEDLDRVGGLPHQSEAQAIWRRLWIEDTHGSTSIEGNPLSEPQVATLLDDDVALGGQSMAAYSPPEDLRAEEGPGGFRVHDVQSAPHGMRPPDWTQVPHRVTDWADRANQPLAEGEHVLTRISALHAEFGTASNRFGMATDEQGASR